MSLIGGGLAGLLSSEGQAGAGLDELGLVTSFFYESYHLYSN
jgi:hypothetical protein